MTLATIGTPLGDYRFNDTWATDERFTINSRRHCQKLAHSMGVFSFDTFLSTEHLKNKISQALHSNQWNHKGYSFDSQTHSLIPPAPSPKQLRQERMSSQDKFTF